MSGPGETWESTKAWLAKEPEGPFLDYSDSRWLTVVGRLLMLVTALRADLARQTRQYERLNLCPDHRDKAMLGRCIVCDGEKRGKEEGRADLAQVQQEKDALEDWRATVTVALQREGGAFYADVPKHIRDMVAALTEARAQRDDTVDLLNETARERNELEDAVREARAALARVQALPRYAMTIRQVFRYANPSTELREESHQSGNWVKWEELATALAGSAEESR